MKDIKLVEIKSSMLDTFLSVSLTPMKSQTWRIADFWSCFISSNLKVWFQMIVKPAFLSSLLNKCIDEWVLQSPPINWKCRKHLGITSLMDTWVSEFLWPSQSFSGAPNMSRCRRGPTWTSWRRSRSRRRSHGGRCWGCGGSRTLRSPSSSWSLGSPWSVLVKTMRVWEEDLAGGENSRGEERKWEMCLDETSSSGQVVRILDWIGHKGGEKQINLY